MPVGIVAGAEVRTAQDQAPEEHPARCPIHGPYTSRLASILHRKGWHRWWTGCPECVLQHHRWNRQGGNRPDLRDPHHP